MNILLLVVAQVGAVGLLYAWHAASARRLAAERLATLLEAPAPGAAVRERVAVRAASGFPARYRWLPPVVGAVVSLGLWTGAGMPAPIAVAAGLLAGVLTLLLEEHAAAEQEALIEAQLGGAIGLLVGALRAGASLLAAFESALQETSAPLRPYFLEVAGRIRLGDDPRAAVSDLQHRVPLESFRLFGTALAIHWEVGGSLATTLSTVGQTVRDRVELGRRVRAQGVESNASVAVVLLISYVLAFLMWRTNPGRMEAFAGTAVGTVLIAGVIVLQAVGLVWMSRLSRSDF